MKTNLRAYLRIKIKSLAAEATLIRKDERKHKARFRDAKNGIAFVANLEAFEGLKDHRRKEVRPEARSALLAYGYLRGRPYKTIEAKCYVGPDVNRISRIAAKYGETSIEQAKAGIESWIKAEAEMAKAA